jgi:hemolysin activation/secretion protein
MIKQAVDSVLTTGNYQGHFYSRFFHFIFSCLIIMAFATPLRAQTDLTAKAAQEHERRLQEEALRHQQEQSLQYQSRDIYLQSSEEAESANLPADTRCFNVEKIEIAGVTAFKPSVINQIKDSYIHRCIGLSEINELIKRISNLYIEKGLITSRAFLQPQNLNDGVLDILVVEGKLEGLDSVELTHRQLQWAIPSENGEILNLRDLEQGLEQLNRLQQNRAELDLQPGSTTGTSKALIRNAGSSFWHAGVGSNNSGSEATGEWLATAYLSIDNPSFSNDNLYFNLSDAQSHDSLAVSKSYSLSYSIPYGYNLYTYSASYFNYQQLVTGDTTQFITSGNSLNQSAELERTIYRGQRDKLALGVSVNRKQSKNYLEDVYLETSSRTLYVTDVSINYNRTLSAGSLHTELQWSKSQRWFDATRELASAEKDFQFNKYTWDSNLSRALPWSLVYSTSTSLFYSPKHIIASEALSLGGRYSVRGFEQSITAYKGGYWRNEIALQKQVRDIQIKPFIGLDLGYSDTPEYQDYGNATLSGMAIGCRLAATSFSLDISYAKGLQSPRFLPSQEAFYLNVQINF